MGEHALPGTPPVPLTLRKSPRARRISLRISQLDGRVTLTYPQGVPEAEALSFARSKEEWIRQHLAGRPIWNVVRSGQCDLDRRHRASNRPRAGAAGGAERR